MWVMISKKYRLPMIFKQLAQICLTDIVFPQQCNFLSNAIKTVLVFFIAVEVETLAEAWSEEAAKEAVGPPTLEKDFG